MTLQYSASLCVCVCVYGNMYSRVLDYWQNNLIGSRPYRSSKVDGHQGMWGQEEVVQSQGMLELWENMAVPCDEPGKCKDGSNLRSKDKRHISSCYLILTFHLIIILLPCLYIYLHSYLPCLILSELFCIYLFLDFSRLVLYHSHFKIIPIYLHWVLVQQMTTLKIF